MLRKNVVIMLLLIISTLSISIYVNSKLERNRNGADKRIYNIYKEIDESVSSKFEPINETKEISIMSYNIRRGKDLEEKYTLEEIINFLKESDVDIICLQEVLFSHHNFIREGGRFKSQFVANIDIPIASTGVATYSKYPIIESNHIILSSKGEPRGSLHTAYRINNKIVNVINVHLGLNKKEREKQIKEILEYCKSLEGEIIIAGDFNQKSVELEKFIDVGKYHGYGDKSTFIPIEARIDYIFMSNDDIYSTSYNVINSRLSDHFPIVANIKYKPEPMEIDDSGNKLESIWLKWIKNK